MLRRQLTRREGSRSRPIFRADIEESWGSDFYVTSLSGESVLIYPLPVWQEIEERLAKLPSLNPTKKKFLDRTNFYGQLTSCDKSGRILIPTLLRESAQMTGEVAVLGYLNHLEVWNHKRFVDRMKDQDFTEEDHETLSNWESDDACHMQHTPVLLDEVMQFLDPKPGGRFIDATFGAGGHTRALLERTAPDGRVLAIDQDESALIERDGDAGVIWIAARVACMRTFGTSRRLRKRTDLWDCDGMLADIGMSSMMVDDPSRGFSFMREGPLDMRMDRSQPLTAADVVNTYSRKRNCQHPL